MSTARKGPKKLAPEELPHVGDLADVEERRRLLSEITARLVAMNSPQSLHFARQAVVTAPAALSVTPAGAPSAIEVFLEELATEAGAFGERRSRGDAPTTTPPVQERPRTFQGVPVERRSPAVEASSTDDNLRELGIRLASMEDDDGNE